MRKLAVGELTTVLQRHGSERPGRRHVPIASHEQPCPRGREVPFADDDAEDRVHDFRQLAVSEVHQPKCAILIPDHGARKRVGTSPAKSSPCGLSPADLTRLPTRGAMDKNEPRRRLDGHAYVVDMDFTRSPSPNVHTWPWRSNSTKEFLSKCSRQPAPEGGTEGPMRA